MEIDKIKRTSEIIRIFTRPAITVGVITEDDIEAFIERCTPSAEKLVTFKSAADQLEVSKRTIARMLEDEELTGKRLRAKHPSSMRIFQSSIDKILRP